MAKILIINPNKWGRGITFLWMASHSSLLKKYNHQVKLFDCTFYENWSENEIKFNSDNKMYKKSDYENYIKYKQDDVKSDLQKTINNFLPDIIFWSSISSHIHSEGEYVNIQYGHDLLNDFNLSNIKKITGGIQATADHEKILSLFKNIDYLIRGETEMVLLEIANKLDGNESIEDTDGLAFIKNNQMIVNQKQKIINDLDILAPYDYSIFEEQTFYRPYNGNVVRAVDFEISRGCIYSCSYCVETVIQKYYSFNENNPKTGAIKNFKKYHRSKSAEMVFQEIKDLNINYGISLFRCQDTNFLTINKGLLEELGELINNSDLDIKLYIETRPEGINEKTVKLLKKLKVDGVGMGVELSDQNFREKNLNRFANQKKTINAFKLLKENKIKRTAYNVIGFPEQDEDSIIQTINFNKLINPDNITLAFYTPYIGTKQYDRAISTKEYESYNFNADNILRTKTKSKNISSETLNYYKKNFVDLVRSEN
tara:strand:+ start:9 stop:1460 length:1452 start_codon:yes stop_codon:yes gene_type:complete